MKNVRRIRTACVRLKQTVLMINYHVNGGRPSSVFVETDWNDIVRLTRWWRSVVAITFIFHVTNFPSNKKSRCLYRGRALNSFVFYFLRFKILPFVWKLCVSDALKSPRPTKIDVVNRERVDLISITREITIIIRRREWFVSQKFPSAAVW